MLFYDYDTVDAGYNYQIMVKSAIVAVKGTSLDYGQRAVCCRPAIDTGSTESEA